jgi:hypothetical protein
MTSRLSWALARAWASAGAVVLAGSSVAACFDFDALSDGLAGVGSDGAVSDSIDGAADYCASLVPQPLFCEDFDRTSLPGRWDVREETGGTVSLDTSGYVSAPDSLLAQYGALQRGQPLNALLRKQFTFATFPSNFVLDFFIQPVRVDPATNAATVVASLDFHDSAGDRYSLQFSLVQNFGTVGVRFEEQTGWTDGGATYTNHPLPDALPLGAWTDLRLEVRSAHARVTLGGTLEIDTPLVVTVVPVRLQLALGSSYETEPSAGWATRFDNVTLDTPP